MFAQGPSTSTTSDPCLRLSMHYNYFRDYDPSVGRYIQADPIGLEGGLSAFNYADASPMVKVDRLGLVAGMTLPCTLDYGIPIYQSIGNTLRLGQPFYMWLCIYDCKTPECPPTTYKAGVMFFSTECPRDLKIKFK